MRRKNFLRFALFVTLLTGLFFGGFTPAQAAETLAFRINAGGGDFTASSGNLFVADKAYTPGDFGYTAGKPITTTNPINNTTDDPLFQSQRAGSTFSYLFDNLPAGDYTVTLHFAEIQVSGTGQRRLDVTIEGSLLLDNYDIFVAAGGSNTAVSQTFLVPVSDGQLNIAFSTATLRAVIAAIEVVGSGPGEPAPDIAVTPSALNFGNVNLGTFGQLNATLSNVGTLDLHVSGLSTTNPVFTVVSPAPPFTVPPSGNLPVTVRFTPAATGLRNANLQIASDDPDESLFNVPLSGNGVQPPTTEPDINTSGLIRIMPVGDSITRGSSSGEADPAKFISYRRDLWQSLVNSGNYVDFVGSLVDGSFYANFDPDHEGHSGWRDDQVAAAIYNWLVANPADVVLLHIGTNALSTNPADVETILNEIDRFETDASTPVTVVLARIINRDVYSPQTTTFNNNVAAMAQNRIANGDKIVIIDMENGAGIVYDIQPAGDMWDNLHPYTTGYSKMAVAWKNTLSTSAANVNFGNVNQGSFAEKTVNISNTGTAVLNVTGLSTTNPVFSIISPPLPFAVNPGNSVPVTVRFTPTTLGPQSGLLQISSNDPDEALFRLSLLGNGVQPQANEPDISVNPTSLDFGQVVVGSTADRTTTIANVGTQNLNVSSLASSNPAFSVLSPTAPFNVAPGNNVVVTLRFTPSAVTSYNGNLQIASNDPDESLVSVTLTGQGVSTSSLAFRINAGGSAYTDGLGNTFVADKAYTPGDFGYTAGGKPITTTNPINNTTDDPLFQGQRAGTTFSYLFDNLPAGDYTVTLHFAEIQVSGAGQRRLDVTIEGNLLLDNYDIFVAAGGSNTAVSQTFLVPVSDGQLNIAFSTATLRAVIAAIEVVGNSP